MMTVFLFFVGIAQCFLIWGLGRCGASLAAKAEKERELARHQPPNGWPSCCLIIPVSGEHPNMEKALRSLLEQNYPDFRAYIITASENDPATSLIDRLEDDYVNMTHVIAGKAEHCGQKNYNILAGITAAGNNAHIYAFCDATHAAQDDFLRCLVGPIARNEAAFTTGYHEVKTEDNGIITLAYALSVLFMRFLQGINGLTQPWGGAMAMSQQAFEHYHIRKLWERNVVDDCSLAAWLGKAGIPVRLCPAALLQTWAARHAMPVWRAWLERQILFLKFCIHGQWVALGAVCILMVVPPFWCAFACIKGILGFGGGMPPFLALCWFCLVWCAIRSWRNYLPVMADVSRWLCAFFCASMMFAIVYVSTFWTNSIVWQNILYHVGKDGVVNSMEKL